MHASQKFFIIGIGFFLGVSFAYLVVDTYVVLSFFAGCICVFLFFARSLLVYKAAFYFFLGFFLGWMRVAYTHVTLPEIPQSNFTFRGVIIREIDQRLDQQKLIIQTDDLYGNVLVNAPLYPEFSYGDGVEIRCTIRKPEIIEGFHYDTYLELSGVYWTCSFPTIHVIAHHQGSPFWDVLLTIKSRFLFQINTLVSEPYASFMAGLLLGVRRGFTPELITMFQRTGTTHILAISGYNITLIVTLMLNGFIRMGLKRNQAFWCVVLGVVLFVLFTGASASVTRAGIMGILVLLARKLGRQAGIRQVLLATALIMVMMQPLVLLYDAGFQLSFLSTLGLIYLSESLEPLTKYIPSVFGLRENATATLAATLATLPLSIFQFGGISFCALFVNVLVLPLMPLVMAFGFFGVMGSFVFPDISVYVAWIPIALMSYVLSVMRFFSNFSWAYVATPVFAWQCMIMLYCILIWWVWLKKRNVKHPLYA